MILNEHDMAMLTSPDFWLLLLFFVVFASNMIARFWPASTSTSDHEHQPKKPARQTGLEAMREAYGNERSFLEAGIGFAIFLARGIWLVLAGVWRGARWLALVLAGGWRGWRWPAQHTSDPGIGEATTIHAVARWLAGNADQYPHIAIIGPTGSGKTTMATLLAGALEGQHGSTLVLSPKVSMAGWRGARVVSLDDNASYSDLASAVQQLEEEKRARLLALRAGERLQPLTIVLDETPDLVAFVPGIGELINSLASIGRELRMRLIVISVSDRVGAWGIKGRGDTRDNFVMLKLDQQRHAVLVLAGQQATPVNTRGIVKAAQHIKLQPAQLQPAQLQPAQIDASHEHQRSVMSEASSASAWTDKHIKAAAILENNPDIGQRELARQLWPQSDGSGGYAKRAKQIRKDIERVKCEA